jgi:CRISPR-associated protein Cmr3
VTSIFIEPVDVLALRGNQAFGESGSYGESMIPPWPSVAAGAIRSSILARDGDPAAFAQGRWRHPALGTPSEPGAFALVAFHLARRANGRVEPLFSPPADLVIELSDEGPAARRMRPVIPAAGLASSSGLVSLPVLAQRTRAKPATGLWLTAAGWRAYLHGRPIGQDHLVGREELWRDDLRIGVGLSPVTRHVEEGKLFSAVTIAFKPETGFLARLTGVDLLDDDLIRLGGDGHGARMRVVDAEWPEPDLDSIAREKRARLVLTTPGLFERGWIPTGFLVTDDGGCRLDLHGVRARLVCAAVPRPEVVSGFDLANWRPKPALLAAPTGSVYWLDELEGGAQALCKLADTGLWPAEPHDDPRRAEGFNRITLAAYGAEGRSHV